MLTQDEKAKHWQAVTFYALFLDSIKSIIAGGAARDILLGQAPRDYDIWLLDDADESTVLQAITDTYAKYRHQFGDAEVRVDHVYSEGYEGAPELSRIDFCIKAVFNGVSIDIIKLGREVGEEVGAIDVLSSFDFPCNQFAILADSRIIGIGNMEEKQVAQRRLGENRLAHMREKLPQFEFIDLH